MSVFEKIIRKEIDADIVFEDDKVIAFKDIAPKAPIHYLIVPKKKIKCFQEIDDTDLSLVGHIVKVAQELAKEFKVADNYRLVTNNGKDAGQTVFHLHFHLIGGKILGDIA